MASISGTVGTIGELKSWIENIKDRSINSLTEYTKKTHITSRVYIEDSISREDGIKPIVTMCNHIYGGLVISAIGMSQMVAGGKTVREMVDMVATEDYHEFVDLIKTQFGDNNISVVASMEANDDKNKKNDDKEGSKFASGKEMELKKNLFSGRLLEVKLDAGSGKTVSIYFFVQLIPYVTSGTVLKQFVSNNFSPSLVSRWAKFKAGEISFWKDFIFEADRVAEKKKALKADKDGILREVEDRRSTQLTKSLKNMTFIFNKNHNAASSIIIISKRSIDRFMKDQGMDYHRYDIRQKIMEATFSMMLVVYDPDYDTVELYMNGFSNAGTYSTSQLADSFKGGNDGIDLKTLMSILQAGNTPKF